MRGDAPRLRMFAGPNGSGKSTINRVVRPELLGVYVNPDDLEREARDRGALDLAALGVRATTAEARTFFRASRLLAAAGLAGDAEAVTVADGRLGFGGVAVNAYHASVAADFLRRKLLDARADFTFETVMSSPDKVAFLGDARARGYRTYLYYVATADPAINVSRVRNRVRLGGHAVPEGKVVSRYYRSLDLLLDAVRQTDRAYVFDNTGAAPRWVAEVTGGRQLELRTDRVPHWFRLAVLDRLGAAGGHSA